MTLKLIDGKVLINTMYVPELKEHTFINFEMEPNTQHLQLFLYINHLRFTNNVIALTDEIKPGEITIKVELLDDKGTIVHIYQSKVAYNVYQVLGNKPIRPDIEDYLYKLEEEIRSLKQLIIDETNRLNQVIKNLEEKGEII
jgi:hypothetical protein